jgi:hypothetical protein
VSCGFVLALRFPGRIGDTLLVCAAASAVLGELVSTYALKNLLTQLGEATTATADAAPPSAPAGSTAAPSVADSGPHETTSSLPPPPQSNPEVLS